MTTTRTRVNSLEEAITHLETNNRIYIEGDFNVEMEEIVMACISHAEARRMDMITFVIDSRGGNGSNFRTISNSIRDASFKSVGLVTGQATSSAFMTLQQCNIRLAYPFTSFTVHWGGWAYGNTEIAAIMRGETWPIDNLKAHYNMIFNEMSHRISCSREQLMILFDTEQDIIASQALSCGIIDEIVDKYDPEFYRQKLLK